MGWGRTSSMVALRRTWRGRILERTAECVAQPCDTVLSPWMEVQNSRGLVVATALEEELLEGECGRREGVRSIVETSGVRVAPPTRTTSSMVERGGVMEERVERTSVSARWIRGWMTFVNSCFCSW